MRRRRDVRGQFTGDPVDPVVLQRILGAAHAAPSVGLSQPWDFVLITESGLRERFADHVRHERAIFAATLPQARRTLFDRIRIDGIDDASLCLVVTYDPARGGTDVLGRHSIADAGIYSVCLAIQNLWLAATAEGWGVGWVSFYRERYLAELIALPARVRPVAWLCLGPVSHLEEVPDLERHDWAGRRPLADALHHNKFVDH